MNTLKNKNLLTIAANMRNAFVERKSATIGGGEFMPEELRDCAAALKMLPPLRDALAWALEQIDDDLDLEHRAAHQVARETMTAALKL